MTTPFLTILASNVLKIDEGPICLQSYPCIHSHTTIHYLLPNGEKATMTCWIRAPNIILLSEMCGLKVSPHFKYLYKPAQPVPAESPTEIISQGVRFLADPDSEVIKQRKENLVNPAE